MALAIHKEKNLFALFAALFLLSVTVAAFTEQYIFAAIPFLAILLYAAWQYKNVVFLVLLFSLPFSFEYNLTPALGMDVPDELLMWLVSFLFVGYCCNSPKVISKESFSHPLTILLTVLLCWMIVTVIFSTGPLLSIKYLLAKGWYLGAFVLAPVILFKNKHSIRTAAALLLSAMLIVTIVILIRHSANDFSFASVNEAMSPFFRNHVNYAAMLVCCIPLLIAAIRLNNNKKIKHLLLVAGGIMLIALFFSYSRGAWLALLSGAIAYWLIKKRILFISYVFVVIITIAGLFWLKSNDRYLQYAHDYQTTIFHSNFNEHLIATYKLKDVSTAERFYRWVAGIRMIKDNDLTGYGPNTFYQNYHSYTIPAYKTWVSDNPDHSTVHNYFLLTTIEQGLPGLIFLLLLLGAMFYYAQKLYHRINDSFYKQVVITSGVMLVMITVLNFLSDLIETDKIGSLFFLCLSVLIVADINTRDRSDLSPHVESIS